MASDKTTFTMVIRTFHNARPYYLSGFDDPSNVKSDPFGRVDMLTNCTNIDKHFVWSSSITRAIWWELTREEAEVFMSEIGKTVFRHMKQRRIDLTAFSPSDAEKHQHESFVQQTFDSLFPGTI